MTTELYDPVQLDETTEEFRAPERWEIANDEALSWTLRKIAAARSRVAERALTAGRLAGQLQQEICRVSAWKERVNRADLDAIMFFEARATDYLRQKQAGDEKLKSISTPFGAVLSVQRPPQIKVVDEEGVKDWLDANAQDLLRVTRSIDLVGLKRRLKISDGRAISDEGEIVPGLTVETPERSYRVETEV